MERQKGPLEGPSHTSHVPKLCKRLIKEAMFSVVVMMTIRDQIEA